MDSPDQNQIYGFLRLFDGAMREGDPRKLLNCPIRPEFLRLLRLDKLNEFQGILDSYRHKSYIAHIARTFQDEIVHRYLMGVPKDFLSLSESLEENFPADPLARAVSSKLIKLTDDVDTEDWMQQETIFLSELRQISDTGSRFQLVIKSSS